METPSLTGEMCKALSFKELCRLQLKCLNVIRDVKQEVVDHIEKTGYAVDEEGEIEIDRLVEESVVVVWDRPRVVARNSSCTITDYNKNKTLFISLTVDHYPKVFPFAELGQGPYLGNEQVRPFRIKINTVDADILDGFPSIPEEQHLEEA